MIEIIGEKLIRMLVKYENRAGVLSADGKTNTIAVYYCPFCNKRSIDSWETFLNNSWFWGGFCLECGPWQQKD